MVYVVAKGGVGKVGGGGGGGAITMKKKLPPPTRVLHIKGVGQWTRGGGGVEMGEEGLSGQMVRAFGDKVGRYFRVIFSGEGSGV